ncbi:hypothetical protein GW932_04840 [archaeon]|nr:hypothetical protein [archaeon]
MLRKDLKKNELDEILEGKGDFVQIDYLNRFIKLFPPIGMRKYAYLKLARIYLDKEMFSDAATMFNNAAINSLTFKEKQENYVKEAKCFVRALKFEEAGRALKKGFAEANEKEKNELYNELLDYYKKEGERLLKEKKSNQAAQIYERLIRMKVSNEDKLSFKEILLDLYQKLGKTKEYSFLKSLN